MIYVRYFASYRDCMGTAEARFPAAANLVELFRLIRESNANALKILEDPRLIVAVNQTVVQERNMPLQPGDEVAFFPPVTGG